MKASRRFPRAHGISTSFDLAVFTMDWIKRVLVFMVVSCSIYFLFLPWLDLEIDRAFGLVLGKTKKTVKIFQVILLQF